jgi:hypothetical protein
VNERIHDTVQDRNRPDRSANDSQACKYRSEEKRPYQLRDHARFRMTGKQI